MLYISKAFIGIFEAPKMRFSCFFENSFKHEPENCLPDNYFQYDYKF